MAANVRAAALLCRARRNGALTLAAALLLVAPVAAAQEANALLHRAAIAARALNYTGTLVYQHARRVDKTRGAHAAPTSGRDRGPRAQLHGDARLPARRARRNDPARALERRWQRIRKTRE